MFGDKFMGVERSFRAALSNEAPKTCRFWCRSIRTHLSAIIAAFVLLATAVIPNVTVAQVASEPEPYRNVDEFGVDLSTGTFNFVLSDVGGGSSAAGLSYSRIWGKSGWQDAYSGHLYRNGSSIKIVRGSISESFAYSGGVWVAAKANGATLTMESTTQYPKWTYTASDGTVIVYQSAGIDTFAPDDSYPDRHKIFGTAGGRCSITSWQYGGLPSESCAYPISITSPAGAKVDLMWQEQGICDTYGLFNYECEVYYRLEKISDQSGYSLDIRWAGSTAGTTNWRRQTKVLLIDRSVEHCASYNYDCSTSSSWPEASYSEPNSTTEQVVDSDGRTWTFVFSSGRMTSITRPGETSATTTISYDTNGKVSSVTKDGVTKTYSWSTSGGDDVMVVSGGAGGGGTVQTNPAEGQPESITNGTSNTVSNTYDVNDRLIRTTWPEGNYVEYTYDARGNVTQALSVPKSGSGLSNITTTASFDATCSIAVKCNKPNYTIDARGKRTDYTYSSTHGQVTRVQLPSPATGQPRPQIDYTYTSLYAKEKNASGVLVNVATPQYKLTQVTSCATAATCSGTANETKVTIAYNTPNLQPTSVTIASGNGSVSSTTTYVYDDNDNLISVDGPLSGTGDTEYYFYDANDRPVGSISPDPDGTGGNPRLATRISYDSAGRAWKIERGTATGTAQSNLSSMTVLQSAEATFDANNRKLTETFKDSSGTKVSLMQYSYDSAGRLQCSAQRMNPSIYGSLPSSACTLGTTGSYGPDRITKLYYDANGRVTRQESAVGTTAVGNDSVVTYTANGGIQTATDGESNRTTYEYDGHDRLVKTRYPVTTKGANSSSTTDYEQLTYGDNVNITLLRLRDGNTISFSYDSLNRLTAMWGSTIENRGFTYNLMGMPLTSWHSSNGHTITNTYDALGRLTSQAGPQGTVAYQYDAASRRTRVTWPDNYYAQYDYDTLGRVTKVRENGATSGVGVLATYAFDSLGRRSTVTYGNGAVRTYALDTAGRLTGLKVDVSGTSADLVIGQVGGTGANISYNPAFQITSLVKSNNSYAWGGHYNFDRNYTANGLNQYSTIGGSSLSYDARGNLTSSSGVTYSYDGQNRLTSLSGGISATLNYDPAGRLYQLVSSGSTSRFIYDGGMMIAEYNGSNVLQRRFVPGPGVDEPIVWYEGSGTSDRRFLQGDERGSIISVSNSSATSLAINTYDEYGIPGSSNSGRFQYTGQIWLDEIGLYYYKARMYSPTLGRFMQTDPIGYGDGMNMYAYVGNDPVNAVDPSGLSCKHTGGIASSGMPLLGGGVVPETYCDPAHPDDDGPPIVVTAWRGIGVSFSIENYIKSGCKDINCQANALEQQRWSQWMADADRDADNGYGKGGPLSVKGNKCNDLDAVAYSLDFVSAVGAGTQLLSGAGALGAATAGAEPVAVFLGGVSAGSSLISTGTSGISFVVKLYNGDSSGAAVSLGTAVLSFTGGRAISNIGRFTNVPVNFDKANLSAAGLAAIGGGVPTMKCGN